MRKKRFLAVVLTASMAVANVVTAAAAPTLAPGSKANGTAETVVGEGQVEGIVDTNIFNVVVPTTVSESNIFDYILDPQELIDATEAARYVKGVGKLGAENTVVSINSGNYTPSSLYFVNNITVSGQTGLSNTSDPFKLINKSTMAVDVSVNAALAGAVGVSVSTDKAFGDKEANSMYMAVKSGSVEKAISTANAADYLLTATMADAKDKYEKVLLSDNATYDYVIMSENANGDPISDNDFAGHYEFQLTGACNTAADWSQFKSGGSTLTAPNVTVTYYLTPHVDSKPSIAQSSYRMTSGQAVNMNVNLGSATGISKITYLNGSGAERDLATSNYTFANNVLTFTASYITDVVNALGANASRAYTITFDDGTEVSVTLTTN